MWAILPPLRAATHGLILLDPTTPRAILCGWWTTNEPGGRRGPSVRVRTHEAARAGLAGRRGVTGGDLPAAVAGAARTRRQSGAAHVRGPDVPGHHGVRRHAVGHRDRALRRDVAARRAAHPRARYRGLSQRGARRLRRSHHRVLPRRAHAVGGVHAFGPRHAPGLPDPGAGGHPHRSGAAGRADRGHLHLVVDHGHGRGRDAAAARRGPAA